MSSEKSVEEHNSSTLQMTEDELISVLESSIYPGAKLNSIKMVISYCRAARLDPLHKPVHIVPMSVKVGDKYEMRDVIMPGIGSYRIMAARTGLYAGMSEPEFGPPVTATLSEVVVTYPEWCRVIVRRMDPITGTVCEFEAKEYWRENYATAGRDTTAPNAVWKRRTFGQLAKCAEAQALRKAFPEAGNLPTADEMEGKEFDIEDHSRATAVAVREPVKQPQRKARPAAFEQPAQPAVEVPAVTGELASPGEIVYLQKKSAAVGVDLDEVLGEITAKIDGLTRAQFAVIKAKLMQP